MGVLIRHRHREYSIKCCSNRTSCEDGYMGGGGEQKWAKEIQKNLVIEKKQVYVIYRAVRS